MRRMLFELSGTTAIAEMLDDVVPKTCDAIWDILPVEGMSIHANWSSREIMLHLQGGKILRLPAEGPLRRGTTAPGDIIFYWRSPQMSRGKQLAYSAQFQRELSEFAIFYGDPSGGGMAADDPVRMGRDSDLQTQTLFARFIETPPDFLRACEAIRGISGPLATNVAGRITQGLDGLITEAPRMRREGMGPMRITPA